MPQSVIDESPLALSEKETGKTVKNELKFRKRTILRTFYSQ